ncbi:hypothetical protein ACET3Z_031563 [Daucus carota]
MFWGFCESKGFRRSKFWVDGSGDVPKVFDNCSEPVSNKVVPPSQENPFVDKMKGKMEDAPSAQPPVCGGHNPQGPLPDTVGNSEAKQHSVEVQETNKDAPQATGVQTHAEQGVVQHNDSEKEEGQWTEVRKRKETPVPEASPSPPNTFKNLKSVDEIDKRKGSVLSPNQNRLTKSQKKKLRLQQGSSSPSQTL